MDSEHHHQDIVMPPNAGGGGLRLWWSKFNNAEDPPPEATASPIVNLLSLNNTHHSGTQEETDLMIHAAGLHDTDDTFTTAILHEDIIDATITVMSVWYLGHGSHSNAIHNFLSRTPHRLFIKEEASWSGDQWLSDSTITLLQSNFMHHLSPSGDNPTEPLAFSPLPPESYALFEPQLHHNSYDISSETNNFYLHSTEVTLQVVDVTDVADVIDAADVTYGADVTVTAIPAPQGPCHLQAILNVQQKFRKTFSGLEYFIYQDLTRRVLREPTQFKMLVSVTNLGQSLSPELIERHVTQLIANAYRCQSEADTPVAQYVCTLDHDTIVLSVAFPFIEGLSHEEAIRQFVLNTSFRFLMDADGYWSDP